MTKPKVVITIEGGLIAVYSDFPEYVSVEVIDLDGENPDYERAEQASQCLERVEIEGESEPEEDDLVTSNDVDCPCDCAECKYADKCTENGRYDFEEEDDNDHLPRFLMP